MKQTSTLDLDMKKETALYYPGVDGLRAVSFFLVFLFHCDLRFMDIGWAGVIVFFVISGFLITDILIKQDRQNSYFVKFFVKRLLRITPISVLTLLGCSIVILIQKNHLPNNWIFYLFNVQNILWVVNQSLSDLNGLLAHTWTLAIEEQFYLLWPFVIFFIPKDKIGWVCLATILLTLLYRLIATVFLNNPLATSVLLLSQTDSLALGALLAFIKNSDSKLNLLKTTLRWSIHIGVLGLVSIIIFLSWHYNLSFFAAYNILRTPNMYLINGFTSQIYLFVALIAWGVIDLIITVPKGSVAKILSGKFLVHIGLISYGLYIYHWPILVALKRFVPNPLFVTLLGGLITYLIAFISYYTIEKFFRSNKTLIVNRVILWKTAMSKTRLPKDKAVETT